MYGLSQADFTHLLESEPEISKAISETVQGRRTALASLSAGG